MFNGMRNINIDLFKYRHQLQVIATTHVRLPNQHNAYFHVFIAKMNLMVKHVSIM